MYNEPLRKREEKKMNKPPKLKHGDLVKVEDYNCKEVYFGVVDKQVDDKVFVQLIVKNKQTLEIELVEVDRNQCNQDILLKGNRA